MTDFTRRDGLKLALGAAAGLPLLAAAPAQAGVVFEIDVIDFSYSPRQINAKVGDTLRITNKDRAPHTLTARDGSFDTGTLKPGKSANIVLADLVLTARSGEYPFFCKFHPKMTGTVKIA